MHRVMNFKIHQIACVSVTVYGVTSDYWLFNEKMWQHHNQKEETTNGEKLTFSTNT